MMCIDDISFLNQLFVILLQFSNIFVVLCVLLKLLASVISKYLDEESECNYENDELKLSWMTCEEAYYFIQAPCRFSKKNAIELPSKPLIWSGEYKHIPCDMKITNRVQYVLLEAQYFDLQPHLSGGPLDGKYTLQHIAFKLRPQMVKSMTDNEPFVLELQAIHIKTEFLTSTKNKNIERINNTGISPIVVINYVYMFSEKGNFALQQMISRFSMIEEHDSSCYLNPFPLHWILPQFTEYYYIQQKLRTFEPYAHSIQWILSPERQTMSQQQMNAFTNIVDLNYTMKLSDRNSNKNEIFFCSEIEEEAK